MDADRVWKAIETERLNLADQLEELSDDQWEVPSLCEGWKVRDVAAHVTLAARLKPMAAVRGVIRARGNLNRFIDEETKSHRGRPTSELVSELRRLAPSRNQPVGTKPPDPLADILLHGQDICRPLGIPRSMPREPAAAAAEHLWKRRSRFNSQKRCEGVRLRATNADFEVGQGAEAAGPIEGVLLVLAGRPAGLEDLSGPGVGMLTARLS